MSDTYSGNISGFYNYLVEQNPAKKKKKINICLNKVSVAMMDSSEKSGNWLMHITELHERITKLTPAFTWLFWILLGISITIAYLSLAFPTLLVNSYFCSYLCSQATFSFAIKVIWRYHFFSLIFEKNLHQIISIPQQGFIIPLPYWNEIKRRQTILIF